MKKTLVSLILLITMVANIFALTSCDFASILDGLLGGNGVEASKIVPEYEVPTEGYDGSEVTITFHHTMGANLREVLEIYIAEFNKLYPNITIEHEQVGGYDEVRDNIATIITQNQQPNIAYCYPDHVALYNLSNGVVNLNSLIASDIVVTRADGTTETLGLTTDQIADFIPGYYEEGRQFGHVSAETGEAVMYTLPFSKSTEVLYYNKTFFEENNLKVPTTWEEMEAVCRQIKAIDPNCIPLGYDSESNWFITLAEQYGAGYTSATGDHFLFDNEINRNFVKMLNTWHQDGLATTKALNGNTYTSSLFVATSGTKSYISIGSSAGASHQTPANRAFEVGIAPIPQVDPSNPKAISQGPSVCIFQNVGGKNDISDQEIVASWLFVKFLTTSVEFQADFSIASGYIPVIQSVKNDKTYMDHLAKADGYANLTATSAQVAVDQVNSYYTSPAFNGSSKARDEVGKLLQAAMLLTRDANLDAQIKKLFEDAVAECEYSL